MIFKQKTKLSALVLTCMMLCSGNVWSAARKLVTGNMQDATAHDIHSDATFVTFLWLNLPTEDQDDLIRHINLATDQKTWNGKIKASILQKREKSRLFYQEIKTFTEDDFKKEENKLTKEECEQHLQSSSATLYSAVYAYHSNINLNSYQNEGSPWKLWEAKYTTRNAQKEQNAIDGLIRGNKQTNAADEIDLKTLQLWETNKAYIWPASIGVASTAAFIFLAKNLFEYLKEKAIVPPLVEETNDVGTFSGITSWFTGEGAELYKLSEKKLVLTLEQKNIVKDYMIALERGIASPHYLFYGPTGTGKTSFARLLAKTTDSYYYFIKGSALVEKNGPSQFRKLMRRVRSIGNRPIIFIDEADKVISDSSKLRGRAHDIFNEILTETGDTNNRTCTFIFTTNKLHLIDMRIKNSKRVQKVYFGLPDISMRIKMIKNNLKYYFTNPEALGDLDTFEYDQMTPEIIKLAAEATKTWDPRSYDYFFESLRRTLIDKDDFICRPKDFFDHIAFIETEEKKAQANELALENQYGQKK